MHKNGNFAKRMVIQQENRDMENSHKTVNYESGIEKEDGVRLILYSADLSSELPLDFADGVGASSRHHVLCPCRR